MTDFIERAAQVLYEHDWDEVARKCACGTPTEGDHAAHQAQALADAGLLARDLPTRKEIADAMDRAELNHRGGSRPMRHLRMSDAVLELLDRGKPVTDEEPTQ